MVNELRLSFMRNANNVGQPSGGVGPSLASQGFVTGLGTPGIVPLAPSIEGIENVVFNSFVMGTPITNLTQANNTFSASDNFSKVFGTHTIKAGVQVSYEQVNVNPNPTFNGSFLFTGSETGSDFADFLIGVASNYNQADSQAYYGRHKYAAAFVQDSWRVTPNLTLNFGVRWDLMQYWSEKYNQIPTFVLGQQSKVFPTAPLGLVYPTDAGVPNTLVPQGNRFAPRLGLAYSPTKSTGLLGKIIGGPGKTSIRAGYGIFYSVIQGNTIAIDEPQPPYGTELHQFGAAAVRHPVHQRGGWVDSRQAVSAYVSAAERLGKQSQPEYRFLAVSAAGRHDGAASRQHLSVQRELLLLHRASVRHEHAAEPELCRLAGASSFACVFRQSGQSRAVPGAEQAERSGAGIARLRPIWRRFDVRHRRWTVRGWHAWSAGSELQQRRLRGSFGNSNYNSFQASLRHSGRALDLMLAYTFSKSIDQASSISDPINPFNFGARARFRPGI